jgi:hypothetical protein
MRIASSNVDVQVQRQEITLVLFCRASAVHGRNFQTFLRRENIILMLERACPDRLSALLPQEKLLLLAAINMICLPARPNSRRPYKRRPPRQLARLSFSSNTLEFIHARITSFINPSNPST